jgi:hypothetical protein
MWDTATSTCLDDPHVAAERAHQAELANGAKEVVWGDYKFLTYAHDCIEEGATGWEATSDFDLFKGTEGTDPGLQILAGTTVANGLPTEQADGGLRIYKAACPNATTVKVGGTMVIPPASTSIEMVFGFARDATGDCAPLMLTLMDGTNDAVKYRWCWNREGHDPDLACDHTFPHLDYFKWHRQKIDISAHQNFVDPLKIALEVYTSGDFRFLPALSDQAGRGGSAMTLIDTLIFGPTQELTPDDTETSAAVYCRETMREICDKNAWCFDKYRCYTGFCTKGSTRCNKHRNCNDDSDEVGCENADSGWVAEFFLSHARTLSATTDVDSLTHPDVRVMGDTSNGIEYDPDDLWTNFSAKEYFAARWTGNFTISTRGSHVFLFPSAPNSHTNLKLKYLGDDGHGVSTDHCPDFCGYTDCPNTGICEKTLHYNENALDWHETPAGKYQVTLSMVQLSGHPEIELKYAGQDTGGQRVFLTKTAVTSSQPGPRCDTLTCQTGLTPKSHRDKMFCKTVPCTHADDSQTCCTREYTAISCGDHRTCALDTLGHPVCWGSTDAELGNEEWRNHPGPFKDISTRDHYTCGVFLNGSVDCWRADTSDTPAVDYTEGAFQNISVGGLHTCARRDTGAVACSGDDEHNQNAPPADLTFDMVTSGTSFSCGIVKADKSVACWGHTALGETTPPNLPSYDYTHLDAGPDYACGISSGTIHCWGGSNQTTQASPPPGNDFWKVAAGGTHACALLHNGTALCWGVNGDGQSDPPEDMAPFKAISAGAAHTCALRAPSNEVVCWGSNHAENSNAVREWRGQALPPPAVPITYRAHEFVSST